MSTHSSNTEMYDIVVIGAGAVGSCIARELSKYRLKVLVLEKSDDVSQGASKANSGIIHGGYDEKHGTLKSIVSHQGNQLFPILNKELNFGFKLVGSLVVGFSEEDNKALEALYANGKANGVNRLFILNREEVLAMEPNINPQVYSALYCPDAGLVSPYEYTIALAENAVQNGVEILLNHEVIDIQKLPHKIGYENQPDEEDDPNAYFLIKTNTTTITTTHMEPQANGSQITSHLIHIHPLFETASVLDSYSDKVAAMVGVDHFRIVPRKGEYIILDKSQGHLANHVLFPLPNKIIGKGILVSPTYHGNLLLGPTSRSVSAEIQATAPGGNVVDQDRDMDNQQVAQFILNAARHLVPGFNAKKALTSYTGYRAKTDQYDFIVEESKVKRFVNVAGIDSPGLTSSPAIAKLVTDIISNCVLRERIQQRGRVRRGKCSTTGEEADSCKNNCATCPSKSVVVGLEPNPNFNPYRNAVIVPKGEDFDGVIDDPDPCKNIICRCERVTEAEIKDAIGRPLPAHTVDSIKKRTRAGMGLCQGRFCEPRVVALISRETGIPEKDVPRRGEGSSILPHKRLTMEDRQLLDKLSNTKLNSKL
ncbi:DAO-domain-containing protein [Basidiobolus meristosporus CBS 931.73]|uniref:DAO-domain-containing protein n=1 Tax=Basidiobolus meristosporus CBS 931.73 TaxID=1314790 RepID=A0A1Y1Y783_9FUNG|nr:DAO-domain-containing protein [Basidiobolus meristosporus CBS 931.73]|eukprot:ORX93872.1 DAO-domain-containing protein [Basidiobolus meristosporus CBS 931.73]